MFKALLLENSSGAVSASVQQLDEARLPAGDVTVAVEYSTVNFKDGMIVCGVGGLVKTYPHVPGVDFSGTVIESAHPDYRPGDHVVLTGWRVGEMRWGGLAQKAVVNGDWLVPLPKGISPREAMAIGTAGLTAMLSVMALEANGLSRDGGEVLVTGAAGGVGSVSTAILAHRGYQVVASSGRAEAHEYLRSLGAALVVDRSPFAEPSKRPLESERWAACIDSVGGSTLARVLAQMRYNGSVASVGLAGGSKLECTVIPFLLRGVSLLGIDSVMCPRPRRIEAWRRLSEDLPLDRLRTMIVDAALGDVPRLAADILKGQVRGRIVVNLAG
jgi:acrylyl-CoA reductase (NADPH)